ncbi:germination protein YpeB [Bacillus taeanensis]|uniref:Germination protein YpeB n=1 Tax=Bacillus taeanensis TaxID=273032 RepID=A0A366XVX7_9BACI|nr:germination protein YpeB [Bacillus taeanensis]RBW70302.1 germination protein YpeB [Bacillus taeanensis]
MIRSILIGILVIAVGATAYWGYEEHQEKNAILINAENNYQRAFHELTYHIDQLEDEIGVTLAMNSRKQLSPALAEVWRITSQAHSDVGQLPLTLLPFNKTEEFLAQMGSFSYRTAVRDLEKSPLTDDEYNTLKTLYSRAGEIKNELRKVQSLVIKNNLRWMDVELALAAEKTPQDNTIIDGFKTVEKNVEGYDEVNWGPEMTQQLTHKKEVYKKIQGEIISKEQAKEKAEAFFDLSNDASIQVNETGEKSEYGAYSVTVANPKENAEIYMDLTKKGGMPIWILNTREVDEQKISLNEAAEKAKQFLGKHKFKNLTLTESAQYSNVGVFSFVTQTDNVLIYPETIKIKVALDNGEITGFESLDYLVSQKDREIKQPAISRDEALTNVNPKLKVQEEHIAIIENDLGNEVLCYEFLGVMNNDTYRIFINGETGDEEMVEKLKEAEPNYESF